ncbi:MAG: outer membrane beta-barrel protein [Xanthobacteraceae bacterium]|nr:outer membrane beta-barrel protein [Xanthobacteraceae bacterium]
MRLKFASLLAVSSSILAVQNAAAADLSTKPVYKAPAAIVAYHWTGPYVGAFVGVTATRSRGIDPDGVPLGSLESTGIGFTGGGTVGYNWELGATPFGGRWLVGLEGDFGYFGNSHSVHDFDDTLIYNTRTKWLGTARGRVGIASGPNLSYFTGGYAAMRLTDSSELVATGPALASTQTKSGWTIGSGVETMLGGGWTAKSETLYIHMGGGDALLQPSDVRDTVVNERRYYTQRFGVNYLFGGGANRALPQTNWSGFYAGVVGGGVVSSVRATGRGLPVSGFGNEIGNNGTGWTAGGQLGWNWMIAPKVVIGFEGDISWMGVDHTSFDYFNVPPFGLPAILGVDTSWFATARGRLAYNTGPALLYVTGGAAWVHVEDFFQGAGAAATSSKTLSGYAVGGGIETALWGNWSSKNEYLYVDVGEGDRLTSGVFAITADHRFHMFRSALVYRFN